MGTAAGRHSAGRTIAAGLVALLALAPGAAALDHECHIFGLRCGEGTSPAALFQTLCQGLYEKTLPEAPRETPSRDGWGFGYFLAPPDPWVGEPILLKGGPPPCEDTARWNGAVREIAAHGLSGPTCVLGHVRKSSYGPDDAALPNPHPFADLLLGRWWLFQHNGHMLPDTLLAWIPPAFLEQHPLDYDEVFVDSELLFRYCQYEIERLGSVRAGLLYALHRVKSRNDFVFNLCLTDGDTLWAAHTLSYTPFYYGPSPDSTAWWASTVDIGPPRTPMTSHHLYWFAEGRMGEASYE